jgi:hypothetical protein
MDYGTILIGHVSQTTTAIENRSVFAGSSIASIQHELLFHLSAFYLLLRRLEPGKAAACLNLFVVRCLG